MTIRPRFTFRLRFPAFALAMLCALAMIATQPAQTQTFSVIHYFSGESDGENPIAGVTVAGAGKLAGTTSGGRGSVFKLTQNGASWTLDPLYDFTGDPTNGPYAGVAVGPNGALYGTTTADGAYGAGSIFEVTPSPTACHTAICNWNQTVLHSFTGNLGDGERPLYGSVIFDHAGNMYGTAEEEGGFDCGVVWKMAPSGSGWTESVIYNFSGGADGCNPSAGVTFDAAGNLYGTTFRGGIDGGGAVYQLTPSNGGWAEHTLVGFTDSTGYYSSAGLIADQSGNLYGTTELGGPNGWGTVFELSPSNGGWNFSLVYGFSKCGSYPGVTLGPDGNLYGVCVTGGANDDGWVFEMPPNCNQTCTANDLHDFAGADGQYPQGQVVFDASGNLYSTTLQGGQGCSGSGGCGVVWEITPN